MRAITVDAPGGPEALRLTERPKPDARPGHVVLKVAAVGVCGQDQAVRAGLVRVDLPIVPGHEIAGEVVDAPKGSRFRQGERVASKQFATCESCGPCRSGRDVDCQDRVHVYGGYAEFVAVAESALLAVPEGISLPEAAVVACAIGTAVQALTSIARLVPGEFVAITGAGGGLGAHALQVARALGGRPIAVSSSPGKVDQLKRLGAESVIDPRADTFQEAMLDATNGVGPQVVLDNVGHPDVFRPCFRSLGHRGRYVFMGQIKRAQINLFPAFVVHKEAVLTGSASTSRPSFAAAMELVRARTVRPIVTAFPLEEAARAHALMDDRQIFGRAVLIP